MLLCFFVLYKHRTAIIFKSFVTDGKYTGHSFIYIFVRDLTTRPDKGVVAETMKDFCGDKFSDIDSDFYGELQNKSTLKCFVG